MFCFCNAQLVLQVCACRLQQLAPAALQALEAKKQEIPVFAGT